jgi:hypothetical protein
MLLRLMRRRHTYGAGRRSRRGTRWWRVGVIASPDPGNDWRDVNDCYNSGLQLLHTLQERTTCSGLELC